MREKVTTLLPSRVSLHHSCALLCLLTRPYYASFRLECYNACNKAFFPQLACERQDQLNFYFIQNHYSKLYLFSRPKPVDYGLQPLAGGDLSRWQTALGDYERCKSYILDYTQY